VQEISPIGLIAFGLMGSALVLGLILLIYANVVYIALSRRLDSILFREPWFTSAEMALFSGWPLCLIKVGHYMFLFTFPGRSRRKRFIGLKQSLPVGKPLRIASNVYIYICIIFLLTVVTILIFAGGIYVIDNWLS